MIRNSADEHCELCGSVDNGLLASMGSKHVTPVT